VKVGSESPEDRFEAAARLADAPGARVAQVLGRTMLVYRKHPTRPKFEPAPRVPGVKSPPARRTPPKPRRSSGTKQPRRARRDQ
jgi:RNA-binding protein